MDSVEMYDPETDKWTVKAPIPRRRVFAKGAGVNGKLYAAGGSDGLVSRAETYEYDPATNSAWQPMASMHTPRAAFGTADAID